MTFPRVDGLRALELGTPGSALQRELNDLVLHGSKRATAGLLAEYEREGEEVEHVGEIQWLIDADGKPLARVQYTRVEIVPFDDVTWEFAQAEGEGFADIDDWRAAHRRYYEQADGVHTTADTLVVCLWFDLLDA